jgi:hypothetical protein
VAGRSQSASNLSLPPFWRHAPPLLATLVVLVVWGLITHGTFAGSGDEPHYQMVAHSLVFDGDFDVANNYADADNLVFDGGLDPGPHATAGKDGRLRPVHDVGLPMLSAPYFLVAYRSAEFLAARVPPAWLQRAKLSDALILRHFLSLGMAMIAAWVAVQLFHLFVQRATTGAAFGWALLLSLSPPLLSLSFLFYTELVSAALALWVLRWVMAPGESPVRAVGAGAATGALFLIHARNIGLIAALVVLALHRLRGSTDRRLLYGFGSGAAVLFALRTAITWHFWGTWLTTPHVRVAAPEGAAHVIGEALGRAVGLLLDQEHGLLVYAPIYLLLPFGAIALWRRERELFTMLAVLMGGYLAPVLLNVTNPHGWRGGWSPAARFLVPIVPMLALVVFAAAVTYRRWRWAIATVVVVQIAISALMWQEPKLLWNDGDGSSALLVHLDGGTGWLTRRLPSIR